MDKYIVFQHVKGGGRFYTSYDPEEEYSDNEHHLIVAKDVTSEMAQELCHERVNENAKRFIKNYNYGNNFRKKTSGTPKRV